MHVAQTIYVATALADHAGFTPQRAHRPVRLCPDPALRPEAWMQQQSFRTAGAHRDRNPSRPVSAKLRRAGSKGSASSVLCDRAPCGCTDGRARGFHRFPWREGEKPQRKWDEVPYQMAW